MGRRKFSRYPSKLHAEFKCGRHDCKGMTSDMSEKGLFIITQENIVPGSPISLTLYLPDGNAAKVQGLVRRAVKTHSTVVKNGMGIEVMEYDKCYAEFLKGVVGGELKGEDLTIPSTGECGSPPEGFQVVVCPACGATNKVSVAEVRLANKCGKCKEPLRPG